MNLGNKFIIVLLPAPLCPTKAAIVLPSILKLIFLIAFSLIVSYLKLTLSKFISEFFNFNSGCKLFSLMLISLSIILLTLLNAAAPEMQSY